MARNPQPAPGAEAGASRLRGAPKTRKLTSSRSHRHMTDTTDHKVGQDNPRTLLSTGPAKGALEEQHIEQVDRPMGSDYFKDMKFAEDELVVMVHDTTNPTDDPVPFVIVNGVRQTFFRGVEQKVKRKYVEVLARMKATNYSQERYKDSQQIDQIRNIPHTALKWPFTVIFDPNPRGRDWLKAILAEGG